MRGRRSRALARRDPAGRDRQAGTAVIEFVVGAVILLLPLLYLLLTVFLLQRAAFGVAEAAREAGRAFVLAPSAPMGDALASAAADIAMHDQGLPDPAEVAFVAPAQRCPARASGPAARGGVTSGLAAGLLPGARYAVCVLEDVPLPFDAHGVFHALLPASIWVVGRYVLVVDRFRPAR